MLADVHLDVKPGNVMIVDGGLVKVLDFGIAILRGADHEQAARLLRYCADRGTDLGPRRQLRHRLPPDRPLRPHARQHS